MSENRPSHLTAYLDGLRGIASLVVFSFHTLWAYCAFVEYGYGDGPKNYHFLQLPLARLIHAGHAMVPVFFVVGGYVMALKPLRRIRADDCEGLHLSLAGSIIRKTIRLYIPAIIVTFASMLSLQFGLWEFPRRFITPPGLYNYPDIHPLPERAWPSEIARWISATFGLTNIFTYYNRGYVLPYYNPYDPHLWYLPFEMRSTLVVSLVLLALSRCRTTMRTSLTLAAIILSCLCDRWECMLFLSGALLADLDMPRLPDRGGGTQLALPPSRLRALLPYVLLLSALFLLSAPNLRINHTPGYAWIRAYFVPPTISDPKRFLHGAGAVLLLAALASSPALQRPFVTDFAREAGRRSYALYVVHGPLLHIVNYSVTPVVWKALGYIGEGASTIENPESGSDVDGFFGGRCCKWAVGFVIGAGATGAIAWMVAGLFELTVERRCIRVARKIEAWCFPRLDVHEEAKMVMGEVGHRRLLPR